MSSCVRWKPLLNLLPTQAKTIIRSQKLITQLSLRSNFGAKTYTLSLDANFAPFLGDDFIKFKKKVSQGCENCIISVSLWLKMPDAQQYKNLLISSRCWVRLLIFAMWFLEKSIAYIYFSLFHMAGHQATLRISIKWILAIGERPEDLIIRLMSFVEDNLLTQNGHISNHDEIPEAEEELFPTLRNVVILIWPRIIKKDLIEIVKQRCCTNISNVSNPGID